MADTSVPVVLSDDPKEDVIPMELEDPMFIWIIVEVLGTESTVLDLGYSRHRLARLDDPKKHWIFEFCWDDILFRIVGKDHWDTYVRHYSTISQAILPNYEKNCIAVGTEAFAVALYENCFDRFHLIVEQQKKRIDDKKRTDPRHKTKMIDCDGGQAKWGGWNKVGRDFCADLRKDVVKAREQEHVHEMEDACLDRIRITHDVEARDKRRGAKSRRKRRVEEVEDESDDEDMI